MLRAGNPLRGVTGLNVYPRIRRYAWRRPLRIGRIGARILVDDRQVVGRAVPLLPEPEDPVDEAVMEVEKQWGPHS